MVLMDWAPGELTRLEQDTVCVTWLSLVVMYDLDRLWSGGLTRRGPTLKVMGSIGWLEFRRSHPTRLRSRMCYWDQTWRLLASEGALQFSKCVVFVSYRKMRYVCIP